MDLQDPPAVGTTGMSEGGARSTEISCRAVANVAQYFEKMYGAERLHAVFARLQPHPGRTLRELTDPSQFTSFEVASAWTDALAEDSGDPAFAFKAGLHVASPQAMGFAYYMLRALASPAGVYRKVVDLGSTFNKAGTFTIEELEPTRMVLRYHSRKHEHNRRMCDVRMGQFAAFTTVWGLPAAHIIERQCQVKGAPHCLYELAWQPRGRPFLSVAAGVGLGTVAGALVLGHLTGLLLGGLLGALVGGALGLAYDSTREARLKGRMLETQDQGLSLSVHDLERRFEEIQHLNQTLELKVQERTQELSLASARLQVALERQLELDNLKTQFFQNVSHELRTPLTLILAPLDSLIEEGNLDRQARGQLDVMRRSAVRLLSMINSLLDLSRLEAGKMRLTLGELDPACVCRHLVESAQELAVKRGITLRYSGPSRLPPIPLDEDKFEKAVLNLLSNALKFTSAGSGREALVEVSADTVEGRLRVSVRDTGIGIPEKELQNVFRRFHQVDGSDERRFGGTGIGLSLVKELVELHHGEVRAESKPGVGSAFTLFFPLSWDAYPEHQRGRETERAGEAAEGERRLMPLPATAAELALVDLEPSAPLTPGEPRTVEDSGRPREQVLLADDNEDMRTYLASILRRDYDVITAADGEQAYDLALQHIPRIIVSDVMMPKKNGYALVRALKKNPATRSIPIILLTAKADGDGQAAGLESGADDYLTKPFNFLDLRDRIKRLVQPSEFQ